MKNTSARILPAKLIPQNIQIHDRFCPSFERFQNKVAKAIAGFTGLVFKIGILFPASSIAPRYDPAKIMVYTALSVVNLVFGSVDERYIKTRKNEPMASKIAL